MPVSLERLRQGNEDARAYSSEIRRFVDQHFNGEIRPSSASGVLIGFIVEHFDGWLWKQDDKFTFSFIVCKQKGKMRDLIEILLLLGYTIEIPTPSARMREIVTKCGYEQHMVYDEDFQDNVEVWRLTAEDWRRNQGSAKNESQ